MSPGREADGARCAGASLPESPTDDVGGPVGPGEVVSMQGPPTVERFWPRRVLAANLLAGLAMLYTASWHWTVCRAVYVPEVCVAVTAGALGIALLSLWRSSAGRVVVIAGAQQGLYAGWYAYLFVVINPHWAWVAFLTSCAAFLIGAWRPRPRFWLWCVGTGTWLLGWVLLTGDHEWDVPYVPLSAPPVLLLIAALLVRPRSAGQERQRVRDVYD